MAIFQETKVKISIVVTLTFLFICIGAIPLLISNWRIITINREELRSNLQESFYTTVSNVSGALANFLKSYQDQLDSFLPKALTALQGADKGQAASELPTLMKDSNFLKVQLLDNNGKGWHAQRVNFQDPVVEDMETQAFRQALQTGSSYVSPPYYDKPDKLAVLIIAEPVFGSSDKPLGTLSAVISLEMPLNLITDESSGGKLVYIVDESGNLLLHPNRAMMEPEFDQNHVPHMKNLSSSAIVSDYMRTRRLFSTVRLFNEKENGKTVQILGAYSPVENSNWGVIIQIEREKAFQAVNKMIRESVQWGVLFALAAALVGVFLARWITDPIQKLAQHALNVGRSQNFEQKIQIKASNEIQQLADTFNYMTDEIKQYVTQLQAAVRENKELFLSSIRMLSAAIDAKDPYTRGHSERVKDYTLIIAKQMALSRGDLERLEIAALLHDVGKIGIEDRILRKPTNLTPEEFEIMKTHPDKGANIMGQVAQLADIIPGMRGHHENYDGSGYPQGLKGDEIHLFARIITVADTFDAMTTDRPYQKAFTLEFALNRIRTMGSIKYDPKVVEAFSHACEEGRITLHKPSRPKPKQPVAN